MSLEGMRRTFIGGTSLALFIDLMGDTKVSCLRDNNFLRSYLPIEKEIIDNLPGFMHWCLTPWVDYHNAASTYLRITDTICTRKLIEQADIESCEEVW